MIPVTTLSSWMENTGSIAMKSLLKQRLKCSHKNYRNIYGDEIIFGTPDFCRSVCIDCGKFFAGLDKRA